MKVVFFLSGNKEIQLLSFRSRAVTYPLFRVSFKCMDNLLVKIWNLANFLNLTFKITVLRKKKSVNN